MRLVVIGVAIVATVSTATLHPIKHHFVAQAVVAVVQHVGLDLQIGAGLYHGAVVADQAGVAVGPMGCVKLLADAQIGAAVDQRAFLVVEAAHGQIDVAAARCNHRCGAGKAGVLRLGRVVEQVRFNRHAVAVDAPAGDVVEGCRT